MYTYFLLEGRKETLREKYANLGEFILNDVLENEFIIQTNFKYADWLLSKLELGDDEEFILEHINNLQQFDRIGKNLEKKDINQYQSLVELEKAVVDYSSKSQEEKLTESDAKRIYEDDRVLVVRPLSHKASCKYGAGTKWCTTQSSPGYFEKYTKPGEALYYVIIKELDASNKFYKMALHKTQTYETWYDATDLAMPPRETEMIILGLGKKGLQSIQDDFKSSTTTKKRQIIDILFNGNDSLSINFFDFLKSDKDISYTLKNPQYVKEHGVLIDLEIKEHDSILENPKIACVFDETQLDNSNLKILPVSIGVFDLDEEFEPEFNWKSLYHLDEKVYCNIPEQFTDKEKAFETFYKPILDTIIKVTKYDEEFLKYLFGSDIVPVRGTFDGYTFQKKGSMAHKLVEYIDAGNKTTALDFLINTGYLSVEEEDGKKIYKNRKGEKVSAKGYFSNFFTQIIRSKIVNYEKVGRKYFLIPGERFEAFKEGKLKYV